MSANRPRPARDAITRPPEPARPVAVSQPGRTLVLARLRRRRFRRWGRPPAGGV